MRFCAFGRFVNFFTNWSTSRTTYPLGYVAALDGSRGLMTLGVLLAHTRMALFGGAMVYMDVFFVTSGYLITSLLIAEHGKHGSIDLLKFYLRRLRRLYPALISQRGRVTCLRQRGVLLGISSSAHRGGRQLRLSDRLLARFWRSRRLLYRPYMVAGRRRAILSPVASSVHIPGRALRGFLDDRNHRFCGCRRLCTVANLAYL